MLRADDPELLRFKHLLAAHGDDLERAAIALLPGDERELVRRLSLVRTFDGPMVETVESLGAAGRSIDEIARHPFVEPSGESGGHRVTPAYAARLRATWATSEARAELGHIARALVAYYDALSDDPESQLDALAQHVRINQDEARARLSRIFDEALDRFDLARCEAVLRTIEDASIGSHGPALHQAFLALSRRLASRRLWSQDHYKTVHYLERAQTRDVAEWLLRGSDRWILQLYAMGGFGKTIFVRNLISRVCAPRDVPCARIELETVPRDAQQPWRLLLRLVEQLDNQLQVFSSLLAELRDEVDAQGRRLDSPSTDVNTFVERLGRALLEARGSQPVVFVLDTLERLLLRGGDLVGLVSLLKRVHDCCPGIRLVLAGRYDVRGAPERPAELDRAPGYVERFGQVTRTIQLESFDDTEARTYLTARRRLAVTDPRVDAIVAKAEGNPFKLSLLADTVRVQPTITAGQIASYERADYLYLIERIVKQIDPDLRWVLRYGVLPRLGLSKDFLSQVLRPYLEQAIHTGRLDTDDPAQDPLPQAGVGEWVFSKAGDIVDVDRLWERLYAHAADYSWVWPEGQDTLRFHEDVVEPMRAIVGDRVGPLHRDAAGFFERSAAEDPANRAGWLREATFHRFASGDVDASELWLKLVQGEQHDPFVTQAMATEVLGMASVTDLGSEPADLPKRSPQVIVAASGLLARSLIDQARRSPVDGSELLRHADLLLGKAVELQHGLDTSSDLRSAFRILPFARGGLDVLKGALHVAKGDFSEAATLLEGVVAEPKAVAPNVLIDAYELLFDALAVKQRPVSLKNLGRAVHLAEVYEPARAGVLSLKLAHHHEQDDDFESARAIHASNLDISRAAGLVDHFWDTAERLVRVELELGRELAAEAALEDCPQAVSEVARCHERRARARVHLAFDRPAEALAALGTRESRHATGHDPVELALEADCLERLLHFTHALEVLDLAAEKFGSATPAADRCHLRAAELCLQRTGQLHLARSYLNRVASSDQDVIVGLKLLEARHARLLGQIGEAQRLIKAVRDDHLGVGLRPLPSSPAFRFLIHRSPGLELTVRAADLDIADDRDAAVQQLVVAVGLVQPPSRRAPLLARALVWCVTPRSEVADELATSLLQLLPSPERGTDPQLATLRYAEVLRVLGRVSQARASLRPILALSEDPVRLLAAASRFEVAGRRGFTGALERTLSRRPSSSSPDQLRGAIALELASANIASRRLRRATELLDLAQDLLAEDSHQVWRARLDEVRAQLARAGDDARWSAAATRALEAYEKLGDARGVERVRGMFDTPAASPALMGSPEAAALVREEATASIEVDGPFVRARWRSRGGTRNALMPAPEGFLGTGMTVAQRVDGLVTSVTSPGSWSTAVDQVRALMSDDVLQLFEGHPRRVRLKISEAIEWFPWELMALNLRDEAHNPSDVFGMGLTRVVRSHAKAIRKHAPGELAVLSLDPEMTSGALRPHVAHGLGPITPHYSEPPAEVRIIHIIGFGVADHRGTLVLTAQRAKGRTLDATALARTIAGPAREGLLCVLDVRARGGRTEQTRQLMLRNQFAADLARASGASVLAIGPGTDPTLAESLSGALAQGLPIGEIANRLRACAMGRSREEAIFYLATALFSDSPDDAFPLRTTERLA